MFQTCGKFLEISSYLLAAYLFNDLSKTFTNVLQITKFYKNHKKISQRQSWANCGPHADKFFCSSPIFSGKIVYLRTCRLFIFLIINVWYGQFGPTLSKKGRLCKKSLNTIGLLEPTMKKFISVSFDQNKTIDLQILRKMSILIHPKVLSMLLLIHQPLLKVALKMKTFFFNTMMKFTQQEPLQHFFVYKP